MSLPSNIVLPVMGNNQDPEGMGNYLHDLVLALQTMYEDLTENINGYIRNNADIEQSQWLPTLNGITPGTFTYTQQVGWSIRQGIYTHVFFDVTWTAIGTAAGNIYLELPYRVTLSSGMPFVGTLQSSNFLYLGNYLVINAIPDTYRGEVWSVAPALPTANVTVPATGRLTGHLMYIGLENE